MWLWDFNGRSRFHDVCSVSDEIEGCCTWDNIVLL